MFYTNTRSPVKSPDLIRLEEAPDGYRAMDERESIKVLIRALTIRA
jgi:hypothetical protein